MTSIKVFVIDDSAVVRQVLTALLGQAPGIEVIGAAADPLFAMERMVRQWPDVIVLDVEMPRMDGLTFLKKIMAERPTPVVICSTLTPSGAETSVRALSYGAVDVVGKPRIGLKGYLEESAREFVAIVQAAARAQVKGFASPGPANRLQAGAAGKASARTIRALDVVALGTSTGGTQALERVLTRLPRSVPGIVIVQHMPEKFTASFAQRLDALCEIEVKEASSRDLVKMGRALIAPGGRHLVLKPQDGGFAVEVLDGPPVNHHKPSVDVLFRSVAQHAGDRALGIIMTGMGNDGARGLKEMAARGALTVAQDEASSVVFGMPKEAIALGAVRKVVPLDHIASEIIQASGL